MVGRTGVLGIVTCLVLGLCAAIAAPDAPAAAAGVPRPDHVVVVIDENHADDQVIGNPAAPYINSLASTSAVFSQFYAETHPSQPNYIALLSGSTQGVTDNSCPHTFSAPNLAAELIASGAGFTGFSQGLPSAGFTGCTSGRYARKHNPWVNFSNVPATANQPFSAFPSDFSTLPAVSFVVPDLDNDMHDGTIAQGDTWLQNNLSGYINWAESHNSLFVLTFDEDDGSAANRIPTLFAGAGITAGTYTETLNHYNLLRTLADAYGVAAPGASATANPILDVWAANAGSPTAAFTTTCAQLTCSFDASGSSDPNGSITSFAWTFGDGSTGTGVAPTHMYAATGPDTVTLTVTDNDGLTATVSHQATPVAPGSSFVRDTFSRTVTGGLGTADVGGPWTAIGTSANFSVSPGAAALLMSKAGTLLEGVVGPAQTDADVLATVAATKAPVGGPIHVSVTGRRVSAGNSYLAKVLLNPNGSVTLQVARQAGGAQAIIAGPVTVAGLSYTAGLQLAVRIQTVGVNPTTVRARVWRAGQTEPTTWQVSAADTTAALQVGGSVGVSSYLSTAVTNTPITLLLSSFMATGTAMATNLPPTAAFTVTCAQLTCSFDGSGSADPEGPIAAYAWTFGDGATGAGTPTTHAFVTAGTYTVTLTVTDAQGATGSVSHAATATAPPVNQPPVAAFTFSCAGLMCTFDGSASSDDEEEITSYDWDFGNGAQASGATSSHTYVASGTYAVKLTVTDDQSATGSVTRSVTVGAAFASDAFGRTVTNGWGSADLGGPWSIVGTASRAAVSPGRGTLTLDQGTLVECYLGAVTRTDADVTATLSLDKIPLNGPVYLSVTARRVAKGSSYLAKVLVYPGGSVTIRLARQVSGTETPIAGPVTVTGLALQAGQSLSVRVQVVGTGSTALRARAWSTMGTEPSAWQVTASDSTPTLQVNGSVGVVGYLSSATTNPPVTMSVTSFTARPTAA